MIQIYQICWRGSGMTWFWGQHECLGITHMDPREEGHLSPCFSQYPLSPQESHSSWGACCHSLPWCERLITLAPLAPNLKLPLHREAKTYHFQRASPTEQHWPLVTKVWSIESVGCGGPCCYTSCHCLFIWSTRILHSGASVGPQQSPVVSVPKKIQLSTETSDISLQ